MIIWFCYWFFFFLSCPLDCIFKPSGICCRRIFIEVRSETVVLVLLLSSGEQPERSLWLVRMNGVRWLSSRGFWVFISFSWLPATDRVGPIVLLTLSSLTRAVIFLSVNSVSCYFFKKNRGIMDNAEHLGVVSWSEQNQLLVTVASQEDKG